MPESILQKYTQLLQSEGIEPLTARSRAWFIDTLSSVRVSKNKMLSDEMAIAVSRPTLGKMYMFVYDPKTKKQLPYYDQFPLVIMTDTPKTGDGFFGLNLHYLSPLKRAVFFQTLSNLYQSTSELNERTKLRLKYQALSSQKKLRAFQPTFKRYLTNHIKSKIVEIPSEYWEVALFLPTYEFKKASSSKVWSDSNKYTR